MIVATHRGPFRFRATDDGFVAVRGAGGVASSLGSLLVGGDAGHAPRFGGAPDGARTAWIAAAIGDDDRAAVAAGAVRADSVDLRLLAFDSEEHRLHYDVVSNEVLWFLHHGLFDLAHEPSFGREFAAAWDAYVAVNERFAAEIADLADDGEPVLVQDYQLSLVPGFVRALRPGVPVAYFHHTPFAGPDGLRVLPDRVRDAIMASVGGGPAGFHARRWVARFSACARELLDHGVETFVAPLGPDPDELARVAASDDVARAADALDELVGDRVLVYRTDRLEPSKNIVRGFLAYGAMLAERRDLHERVVFVASLYPSRESLPAYAEYAAEVARTVDDVNERFGTAGWQPVLLDVRDDFARSVAGLTRYDVLLVNPVRDGLNLVAKEGPLVNRRAGVVCLSPETGAHEELAEVTIACHPFDLDHTAAAIAAAIDEPIPARRARAEQARAIARAATPATWLAAQLHALGVESGSGRDGAEGREP